MWFLGGWVEGGGGGLFRLQQHQIVGAWPLHWLLAFTTMLSPASHFTYTRKNWLCCHPARHWPRNRNHYELE